MRDGERQKDGGNLLVPLSHYRVPNAEVEVTLTIDECLHALRHTPSDLYDGCVTSPPYYFVRDYSHPDQIGLERTREKYITALTAVFTEVLRVM